MDGMLDTQQAEQVEDPPVLVVVMNNQRDWQIVQTARWYRIPLQRAPKQVAAAYLAFYQTAAFPEERWIIRSYASVESYRLVTRRELLPDEPDHPRADELYYRVALGPLRALPHPIPSRKLRRITFIPTTLQRLLAARDVSELWPAPAAATKLWYALQAAGLEAERDYEIREGRVAYTVDLALFCQRGGVGIACGEQGAAVARSSLTFAPNWSILRFGAAELADTAQCVRRICDQVAACGGLDPLWREADD